MLKAKPNQIVGSVIKLRCVNVKYNSSKPNNIELTNLSSCLLIPDYFYDS